MSHECCICYDTKEGKQSVETTYLIEEPIQKLPCCTSSFFHKSCLSIYMTSGGTTCPVCQQVIIIQSISDITHRNMCYEKIYNVGLYLGFISFFGFGVFNILIIPGIFNISQKSLLILGYWINSCLYFSSIMFICIEVSITYFYMEEPYKNMFKTMMLLYSLCVGGLLFLNMLYYIVFSTMLCSDGCKLGVYLGIICGIPCLIGIIALIICNIYCIQTTYRSCTDFCCKCHENDEVIRHEIVFL